MKPVLYADSEMAFTNNGVGALSDAVSCYVDTELNGIFELEMQYPVKGIHFSEIRQRSIILAKPDAVSKPQPFRVYRISKAMGGLVTVYARHAAYDLMGHVAAHFSATNVAAALQTMKARAVPACPFNFRTDKTTQATMTVPVPTALWTLLGGSEGSILDTYGGEYEFDRWDVILHNKRGQNRGVSIRYGKNLTSLEQDENCANCYTGVYPYWVSPEGTLVQLDEQVVNAVGNFGYVKILPLDFSQEWEEAPTAEQLRARAQRYIRDNDIGVPTVSWEVGFVQLEQTEEYKDKAMLEQIHLGDTVSVTFSQMGVNTSSRAVKTRYNVLLDRYESVTLGSVKANIADTVADNSKKILVESQKRISEDGKLSSELALQDGKIAAKVEKVGGSPESFGWELLVDSWTVKSKGVDVFKITEDVAEFTGKVVAKSGKIGGFDILENYLSYNGQTWGGKVYNGGYFGDQGVQMGTNFQVDMQGHLYAEDATISGTIYAKGGTFEGTVYATDGYFEGTVYAGKIQYGGDAGTFSGAGITSRTVTGSTISYGTITTGNTSSGINASLANADYAYGCVNGWTTVPAFHAGSLDTNDFTVEGHQIDRATIQYTNSSGGISTAKVLIWS